MALVKYCPNPLYVSERPGSSSARRWSAPHLLGIGDMLDDNEAWFIDDVFVERRKDIIETAFRAMMRQYHPDRAKCRRWVPQEMFSAHHMQMFQYGRSDAEIARDITVAYKYLTSRDLCRAVLESCADENYLAVSRASDTQVCSKAETPLLSACSKKS